MNLNPYSAESIDSLELSPERQKAVNTWHANKQKEKDKFIQKSKDFGEKMFSESLKGFKKDFLSGVFSITGNYDYYFNIPKETWYSDKELDEGIIIERFKELMISRGYVFLNKTEKGNWDFVSKKYKIELITNFMQKWPNKSYDFGVRFSESYDYIFAKLNQNPQTESLS